MLVLRAKRERRERKLERKRAGGAGERIAWFEVGDRRVGVFGECESRRPSMFVLRAKEREREKGRERRAYAESA